MTGEPTVEAAPGAEALASRLEPHRRELTAYAYRMLGSAFEAEDAVQETLLRAWRGFEGFEGRAALRSWLYRIATNVCLDMLRGRSRRALPIDLGPARTADAPLGEALPEVTWLEPVPDARVLPTDGDPAALAEARETVRLAFVAALQHLPARQRAVLILRDVLAWRAAEAAELLDTSVASVNSALQRARASLGEHGDGAADARPQALDDRERDLLGRYLDAFERYDMDAFTALLREDASWTMPPYPLWLRGHDDIRRWCLGPGSACRGSRLVATAANGQPAFGQYKPAPDGGHRPWALQVLEVSDGRVDGVSFFLDTARWFPLFGLPDRLEA